MTDPTLDAARFLIGESLAEIRGSLEAAPIEALNWRPVAGGNSMAVVATHALGATRLWLHIAMGLQLPERDRESEFRAKPQDADEFRRFARAMSEDCGGALGSAESVDWSAIRSTHGRGGDAPAEVTAVYALVHATEHLRGHVYQLALMRQLWEVRA